VAIIAADDCYANIVQAAVDVYESTHREAFLLPLYVGEKEAVELLLRDSVRLAILARKLTNAEIQVLKANHLDPRMLRVAVDGIAIVVNRQNRDSLISVADLRNIMCGKITKWSELYPASKLGNIDVVFDHPASSTLRYISDSICAGEPLATEHLHALHSNREALDYVARTPNAMGIVGAGWVISSDDSTRMTFDRSVRVMAVSRTSPAEYHSSFQPYQAYLFRGDYPLRREVYAAITDELGSLPSGFLHFFANDKGQRLILKSGLVPASMPVRTVQTRKNL
jgi:phosphate transport system substrate-binding protein